MLKISACSLLVATLLITPCHAAESSGLEAGESANTAFQWDGLYSGVSFGAYRGENDWTTPMVSPTISGVTLGANVNNDFDVTASRPGILAGYNWRLGAKSLVGIEADIGLTDRQSDTRPIPATDFTQFGVYHPDNRPVGSVKANWDASLRARLGFLVNPNTLLYGSAGVAWQKITVNASCAASPGDGCVLAHDESVSKVLSGWTAGLGLEYRFSGNWLARADYRYSDFGTFEHTFFNDGFPPTDDRVWAKVKTRSSLLNVGLVYKF